jgi:hypothetical protein
MRNLNLVDRSLLPPPPDWLGLGLLASAALGLLLVIGHYGYERHALRMALHSPGSEAQGSDPASEDTEMLELSERSAQRAALRDALRQAGTGVEQISGVFEGVTSVLPADMWLDEVELHGSRALRIEGQALLAGSLARFSQGLASVQVLKGLPVQSIDIETVVPARTQLGEQAEAGATAVPVHRFKLSSGRGTKGES